MKAFVAGGTGFIGSHIVKHLAKSGFLVKVLIRETSNLSRLVGVNAAFVKGDILVPDSMRAQIKDSDLVICSVGVLGQWGIPDKVYWDINKRGVENLLESCVDSTIKQFVYLSSAGVLGPLPGGVLANESFPYNPSNIYEQTKCQAEESVINFCTRENIPYTIIRPEFVYGPEDTHVLGLFKAVQQRKFVFIGKGETLLHPTYIDDLIHGIHLCTRSEKAVGKIYFITGEKPITVKELVGIMAEELKVAPPNTKLPLSIAYLGARIMEWAGKLMKFNPPLTKSRVRFFTENRAFSNEKAAAELGYTPQIDFRDGVKRTVRWYKDRHYL
jgi:nucleoside-diphosphate-sugar epimerase